MYELPLLTQMANAIRALSMDAVEKAQSGHPGLPMGMADVATVLYAKFLKFNPHDPSWPNRDRFVLSAGHGSMLLYSLLYLTGYEGVTLEQIQKFRQLGSRTAGHPEYGHCPGVETTTGPLGQGLANAVGMAIGERSLRSLYGADLVNHKTIALVGDGCLMEGISQEAISFAGSQRLSNLIVLFDNNHITIDGDTRLATVEDHIHRVQACGWRAIGIDGHDPSAIEAALEEAYGSDAPTFIACRTLIGFGAPTKGGTEKAHGAPLGAEEVKQARIRLGWTHPPFEIPEVLLDKWRTLWTRCRASYESWEALFLGEAGGALKERLDNQLPAGLSKSINSFKSQAVHSAPAEATRQSSERVLNVVAPLLPQLVGGSADLTSSNNTRAKDMSSLSAQNPQGRYIHYGVREHAMGGIMNGLALYGGFIPYGGTFLVFSDYCRPAIRLSALMKQRVIYVMTHDSIGLGEDGPTHQPIEHLASLRAIPRLNVFRPADAVETAECWQLALESLHGPSVLALSRQTLPTVRTLDSGDNLCARGGYVLREEQGAALTLMATGSEVSLALKVKECLSLQGIAARVVSMPCTRLFELQTSAYKTEVLGDVLRVSIEAACATGWRSYVGDSGLSVSLEDFGASAPAPDLLSHFGFTDKAISRTILSHLSEKRGKNK